ncbi:MAG: DNA primase [Candidatus Spechtbacterales bacterium]|nr:DNA primase [Candidatus Spechtbacterales bacterium]
MDPVEEIKNKLDIKEVIGGYIRLEKSGINYRALCPFHKEKTPSFFVSPTRQLWRCFGCGEGGDVFTFVESIEGVGFPEALRILAKRAGVELKKQDPKLRSEKNRALEICDLSAKYFEHQLESNNGKKVVDYLEERGLTKKSIESFKIGYAPHNAKSLLSFLREKGFKYDEMVKAGVAFYAERTGEYISRFRGRIIFPIFNINGDVVGFGGRKLTKELLENMGRQPKPDSAKYINSPQSIIYDKSRVLYGLGRAKMAIRQEDACIVVEGYTDVIMAHQSGYQNVVAASGTALNESQLELIYRFTNNLLTCFDMDIAGDTATRRGIDAAQAMGFDVKVITLKEGKDPAEMIQKDEEAWNKAIKEAKSVVQFYFDSAFEKYDPKTPEGKREIGKTMARVLYSIPSKIEQSHWIQNIASRLNVSETDVVADIKAAQPKDRKSDSGNYDNKNKKERVSREELLLQHILMSVLSDPMRAKKALEIIDEEENESHPAINILDAIKGAKTNKEQEDAIEDLGDQEKDLFNQLLFEIEIRKESADWSDKAFESFLLNYKKLELENQLSKIHSKIEENDSEGKEDKDLLDLFNKKTDEKNKIIKELSN